MFRKVLVANRGEIAVRVMRACQELDVATVAIYSEADAHAGHARYADEAYNVGPTAPAESYLDGDAILEIAERAEVDAIHPGYGFLAENPDFARRVEESAITWIGPPSEAMEALGEKTRARQVMQDAGVPVIPGTTDPVDSPEEVRELGDDYGYPIVIKAEGGGGGRGIKVVHEPDEIEEAFESARREGDAYFDNPSVYVEKYLPERHIEVQILADEHGNVRHLGERDCSLQRRNQKLVEEAPSPALDPDTREEMGEAARRGVEAAGYTNAGTVEFLVDGEDFYFMEVNARIQVEHTVTEEITGLDIVKWQLRVAAGEEIGFEQEEVRFDGHAIEYRINAENPAKDFAPAPGGRFETYNPPGGIGVRVDDAVRQGDDLVTDYDSMFAKLIVRAGDREECLARSARALREFDVEEFHTTIPFHQLMIDDEAFVDGTHTTDYLDEELEEDRLATAVDRWGPTGDTGTARKDARGARTFTIEVNGKRFDVAVETDDDTAPTERPNNPTPAAPQRATAPAGTGGDEIVAEMEGSILSVAVDEGDEVAAGDVLCVLEAMKMENDIVATANGTVATVAVAEGDRVTLGDVLVVIE